MKRLNSIAIDIFFWILGCAISAAAITMLLEPNGVSPGGFTGIATLINHLIKIPVGTVLFLLNVPIIIIQFKKFGRTFFIKTTVATFILSLALNLTEALLPKFRLDGVLAAVFGGIMLGFGLSLVLLHSATTGGVDVIAKLINTRFRHITVGRVILFFDFFVVGLSALVYGNISSALYSLISIYASSSIIDIMLYGGDKGKLVLVITGSAAEIAEDIIKLMQRGVTQIPAIGVYSGDEKKVLLCGVRIDEVAELHRIIHLHDKKAFVIVTDAGEILGEGFKQNVDFN